MATWRDGLSDLEREMLVHSESLGLSPYARTPAKRPTRSVDEEDVRALPDPSPDPDAWRLMNTAWCESMPSSRECLCCRECLPAKAAQPEGCITEHADFALVCLQPAVLRVAFWALEDADIPPTQGDPMLRFVAYRQFVRWMWQRLGRHNRRILPACVVCRIREQFPSDTHTGFLDPE
ncbi:hypothetical protein HPB47_013602 [Ixodes persulcatus]|uniref:Uncharacterized protein n=1 Tax=Ixodes persulcatus TaxID=34615 RepID=A0AC60R0Z3_IXOPE|nr:hypothetical protein HPB47_013602 [Ixodes persulcatus]